MRISRFFIAVCILVSLQSCEFNCSVGNKDKGDKTAKGKDSARIYNNIQLKESGIKVDKAYLLNEEDRWVADDNLVEFKGAIKLKLRFASNWNEENGKVFLGASEKIIDEKGEIILEEADLFEKYPDGISPEDAKSISLSAILKVKEGSPPTSFTVSFKVWDKKGDAFVEGSYKLYSK